MSTDPIRTDKAHTISYPTTADKRGSTRVNHRRRPYYLGPYDSPASYVMFGLWKHHLMETGEAPSPKELRPIVHSLLSQQPLPRQSPNRWKWLAASGLTSAVILAVAILFAAKILSSDSFRTDDEIVLTETEAAIIRGYRAQSLGLWQNANDRSGSIAALTVEFMEEGTADGLRHISGKNF